MNKTTKRNVLVSAILSIMLCASLIAGATFALFTSESKVNIAISSGKIDVQATIGDLELYSPTEVSMNGTIIDDTNAAKDGRFGNGGTAAIDGSTLKIDGMSAGDKATFKITIENNSTITAKYQTKMTTSNDTGLFDALNVTVDGETFGGMQKTAWELIEKNATIEKEIVVELPLSATAQDAACEIDFSVSAVQGNASNVNEATAAQLREDLTPVNGVIELTRDYELTDAWTPLDIKDGNVYNPQYQGKITIKGNGHYIAGLTAALLCDNFCTDLTVENLTFKEANITDATAKTTNQRGILIGYLNVYPLTVTNCHVENSLIVSAEDTSVGAFVGSPTSGALDISNCSVKNTIVKAGSNAGGIIGLCQTKNGVTQTISNCEVKNCTISSTANGSWRVGAIVGTVTANGNVSLTKCTESDNVLAQSNKTAPGHNLYGRVTISGSLTIAGKTYVADGVMQTAEGVYEIANANGMFWFADKVKQDGAGNASYTSAILTADIDLENREWKPIGQTGRRDGQPDWYGTFDGNGHTISNLNITTADSVDGQYATGLFGWSKGVIKNLTVDGATIVGSHYVGTIVGYVEQGSVENCTAKNVTITAKHISDDLCGDKIGGIVGFLNGQSSMKNCKAENITIEAGRDAGVLLGCRSNNATVSGCSVSGTNTITAATGCTGVNFDDGTATGSDGVGRID